MAIPIGKQHVDVTMAEEKGMAADKVMSQEVQNVESAGVVLPKHRHSPHCVIGSLCMLFAPMALLAVVYVFVVQAEVAGKVQVKDFGPVTVHFNIKKLSISMQREKVLALSKFSKDTGNTSLMLSNPNFCTEEGQEEQGTCESFGEAEVMNLTWLSEEHVSAMVKLPGEEEFEFTTGRCGLKAEDPCEMIQGPGLLMDAIMTKRFATNSTIIDQDDDQDSEQDNEQDDDQDDNQDIHQDHQDDQEDNGDVVAPPRRLWGRRRRRRRRSTCGMSCGRCWYTPGTPEQCHLTRRRSPGLHVCRGCSICQSRRRRLPMFEVYYRTCERNCFPGAATVRLADGTRKQISALQVGDFIQTFDAEGGIQYEQLLGDFHGQNDKLESYLQLILQDGRTLEVSEGHLIFVADVDSAQTSKKMQMRAIRAAALQPGVHTLLVAPDLTDASVPENDRFAPQKLLLQNLSAVRRVTRAGVYAPFTLSGQLIVDGVATSSYALLWPESILQKAEKSHPVVKRLIEDAHPIMHAITAPLRWSLALATLAPVHFGMETKREGAELHWFAQAGQSLFETGVLLPFFPGLWTMVRNTRSTCMMKLPFSPDA